MAPFSNISSPRGWALSLLLLSLALKSALILTAGAQYDLASDDRSYVETARVWAQTGSFTYDDPTRPTVFVMPGFPAFLALVYSLVGGGFAFEQAVRLLQSTIISAALFVFFEIGSRVFSKQAALAALAVAAFYPPFWLMGNVILTEALFLLPLSLLLLAAVRILEAPTQGRAALFALAWVGSVYVRPAVALWPGLLFLLLIRWRLAPLRFLAKAGAVTIALFALALSPWWVRNYRATGHFIPLTKSSGNPLLLGTFIGGAPPIDVQASWYTSNEVLDYDDLDLARAKQRIREGFRDHFREYFTWYTYGKFREFWKMYYWRPIAGIPDPVVSLWHKLICLMGLLGMWLSRRSRPALTMISLLLYATVLHMIYLGHGRYSAPFMPVVILFAGHAVVVLGRRLKDSRAQYSRNVSQTSQ